MNQKTSFLQTAFMTSLAVGCSIAGVFIVVSMASGSVTRDTVRGTTNSYSSSTATTTPVRVLTADSGRVALELWNEAGVATKFWLQSTSTGVVASKGIRLTAGGSYTPEFVWLGEVWVITESGTSTVGAQSTK